MANGNNDNALAAEIERYIRVQNQTALLQTGPRPFFGNSDDRNQALQFFNEFEANTVALDDNHKKERFIQLLRAGARKWAVETHLENAVTWADARNLFLAQYLGRTLSEVYKMKLSNMRFLPQKSLLAFVDDYTFLYSEADNDAQEVKIITDFKLNLPKATLRLLLNLQGLNNVVDIASLRTLASRFDDIYLNHQADEVWEAPEENLPVRFPQMVCAGVRGTSLTNPPK